MFVRKGLGMGIGRPPWRGGGVGEWVGLGEGVGRPEQNYLKKFENCMKLRRSCSERVGLPINKEIKVLIRV